MSDFKQFLRDLSARCEEEFEEISEDGGHRKDISGTAETVTEVDERMTDVIIEAFRERPETFNFASEELKKDQELEVEDADYTVVFDEIDGTGNMKNNQGPFGPIVGVTEGSEPEFRDVIACIFHDLRNDVLYEAYKEEGAYMDSEKIKANDSILEEKAAVRGLADQAMLGRKPELADPLWKYHCKDFGSMGFNLALVASDRADFFITGGHSHLKDSNTAEEIGPLYLLLKEAGAVMVDWRGNDIAEDKIGMADGKSHDIIAAASQKLADNISDEINIR